MSKRDYYSDKRVSENYSQRIPEDFTKREIEIVKSLLPNKKITMLDMPCGYGRLLSAFDNAEITGADYSKEMLGIAKRNHNNTLVQCDATKMLFKDNSFDVILSMHFIYHYKNIEKILEEFGRVTRDMVIFDTNNYSLREFSIFGDKRIYIHGDEDVRAVLERLDLDVVETKKAFSVSQRAYGMFPRHVLEVAEDILPLKTYWKVKKRQR